MKNTYFYITIVVLALVLTMGGYVLTTPKRTIPNVAKTNETILYFGDTCPHCKDVDEFLVKNKNIETKIPLVKKEVYNNRVNAMDMEEKATICKLDTSQGVAVPFLYFKGECIVGSTPITNFLTEKAK